MTRNLIEFEQEVLGLGNHTEGDTTAAESDSLSESELVVEHNSNENGHSGNREKILSIFFSYEKKLRKILGFLKILKIFYFPSFDFFPF